MNKQLLPVLILLLLLMLSACTENALIPPSQETEPTQPGQTDDHTLYEMLFDINNKITLQLDMSEEALARMQSDYEAYDRNGSKSPVFRIADLKITITTPTGEYYEYTIPEVGVRMKGNTSRTSFYDAQQGVYNLIHLKLSFCETFDNPDYYGSEAKEWTEEARQIRKNRTFATLEKLDIRWNRCDDSTYLKEYYAYETYRNAGVPAPRTNLASVDWAGSHVGVYTIYEPVDRAFLEKNFPEEALGGDLYKLGWAGSENGSFTHTDSIGVENEDTGHFYAYDLKTNKNTSNHQQLQQLIRILNTNPSKEDFASVVDIDTFLPYCAVSYLLGNPDDLRNNYNNSYIYFRADTGKMVVIPYDCDRCLGVTAHWNPTGDGVTSDDPFSLQRNADGSTQHSPLFLYSVCTGGYYAKEYAALLEQYAGEEWFSYENFAAVYAVAAAHYAAQTKPDRDYDNTHGLYLSMDLHRSSDFSAQGNISIEAYMTAKKHTLRQYLQNTQIDSDPSLSPPATWYIRADFTDWQNDDHYTMSPAGNCYCIHIRAEGTVRLKIYNDQTGQWFGTECISDDCTVGFRTDNHTNIILDRGAYVLTFDPETQTIFLEKE